MNPDTYQLFERELDDIKNNNYRFLKTMQARNGKHVTYRDRRYINLSSNDYLGLASNADIIREFYTGLNELNCLSMFGPGSSSSRLLTGDCTCYTELEMEITAAYRNSISESGPSTQREALVFTSGYHANTGIIPVLAEKGDIILSDRLNHASIIDGTRLSRADCFVYGHLNYEELANILDQKRGDYNEALIISESVFSMDGDIADIRRLAAIRKRFGALLYLDEAHAFGVFGDRGLGIADRDHAAADIDVIVGTFGKALGGHQRLCRNGACGEGVSHQQGGALIFTRTSAGGRELEPLCIAEAIGHERTTGPFGASFRPVAVFPAGMGISTRGESQIVPAILGGNEKAIMAAGKTPVERFPALSLRPPSVPHGSSRIRISLRADLDQEDIYLTPEILREFAS